MVDLIPPPSTKAQVRTWEVTEVKPWFSGLVVDQIRPQLSIAKSIDEFGGLVVKWLIEFIPFPPKYKLELG